MIYKFPKKMKTIFIIITYFVCFINLYGQDQNTIDCVDRINKLRKIHKQFYSGKIDGTNAYDLKRIIYPDTSIIYTTTDKPSICVHFIEEAEKKYIDYLYVSQKSNDSTTISLLCNSNENIEHAYGIFINEIKKMPKVTKFLSKKGIDDTYFNNFNNDVKKVLGDKIIEKVNEVNEIKDTCFKLKKIKGLEEICCSLCNELIKANKDYLKMKKLSCKDTTILISKANKKVETYSDLVEFINDNPNWLNYSDTSITIIKDNVNIFKDLVKLYNPKNNEEAHVLWLAIKNYQGKYYFLKNEQKLNFLKDINDISNLNKIQFPSLKLLDQSFVEKTGHAKYFDLCELPHAGIITKVDKRNDLKEMKIKIQPVDYDYKIRIYKNTIFGKVNWEKDKDIRQAILLDSIDSIKIGKNLINSNNCYDHKDNKWFFNVTKGESVEILATIFCMNENLFLYKNDEYKATTRTFEGEAKSQVQTWSFINKFINDTIILQYNVYGNSNDTVCCNNIKLEILKNLNNRGFENSIVDLKISCNNDLIKPDLYLGDITILENGKTNYNGQTKLPSPFFNKIKVRVLEGNCEDYNPTNSVIKNTIKLMLYGE